MGQVGSKKILYYDCTNYYFEIQQDDDFRKYGKSKENRPNPIVTMGLFMDADGIPLAFDVFPGNQNEQITLKPLESKVIRDFECSEFIFCSDAGLGSKTNRRYNSFGNRSYVITQSLKKMNKEDKQTALLCVVANKKLLIYRWIVLLYSFFNFAGLKASATWQSSLRKRDDNHEFHSRWLSALRLCVWLFNYGHIHLFDIDNCFLLALLTKERKIFKHGILSDLNSCFVIAYRA